MQGPGGDPAGAERLARHFCPEARVVCVDLADRASRAGLPSALEYHLAQYASDIGRLLAHLRVTQVDWIGTGLGGVVGMAVAGQADGPVRRLVLDDVGAWVPGEAISRLAPGAAAARDTGLHFWQEWYRVRQPVLLLRTPGSSLFPRHVADTMLEVKPHARLVEPAVAGPAAPLMGPARLAALRAFLFGVASGPIPFPAVRQRHEPRQRLHPPRAA